ncbi:hypothetical protein ABD91_20150 [Lysinibacillus sphaericus]|uniref:hypothetical protein n=1 Tax=Lysinibacillus sphaericus TaxID=1421 RepID=UPI0018CEDA23|nr:hypothetical protein [Lysinibacillus sphaericus]MBG9693071.1 hypothetical protein [Lysinibacillus sphaericus]
MLQAINNRASFVMSGNKGASNLEYLGFAVLTLVILGALFLLGDAIIDWLGGAEKRVDGFGGDSKGNSVGGFE